VVVVVVMVVVVVVMVVFVLFKKMKHTLNHSGTVSRSILPKQFDARHSLDYVNVI